MNIADCIILDFDPRHQVEAKWWRKAFISRKMSVMLQNLNQKIMGETGSARTVISHHRFKNKHTRKKSS